MHGLVDINANHILKDKTSQTRTGSGQFTFQHIAVNKDIYANSFYLRTIPKWNSLPIDVRTASSVEQFKFAQMDINSLLKNSHYQYLVSASPACQYPLRSVCSISSESELIRIILFFIAALFMLMRSLNKLFTLYRMSYFYVYGALYLLF